MISEDICVGCGKKGKLSHYNQWICNNKKCDFGKNHKKREWKNPDLYYKFEDVLWQLGFWGSLILLGSVFIDFHTEEWGMVGALIVGLIMLIATLMIGFLCAEGDVPILKKMFWWISKPIDLVRRN